MVRDVSVILLFNDEGKVLLQQRALDAKRTPSKWGFFGGGIEKGETELDAVLRECFEETHYKLTNPKFIGKESHNGIDTLYIFSEKYDNKQEIILGEGRDYGWFKIEEVENLDIIEHDKEILLRMKQIS